MPEHAIACPFCGLVCDDLALEPQRVDTRGCAKSAAGFARRPRSVEHRIAGRAVPLDEAAAAAAELLGAARLPLVSGLAADLAGIRALIALADRLGAVIDRWQSAAQQANLGLLQRAGGLTATFGEIANRADVVLLIGGDPTARQPRFFERLLRNRAALYRTAPPHVAFVGPAAAAPADAAVSERVTVSQEALLDAVGALAASGEGAKIAAAATLPLAALRALADRLAAARYGVLVWDIAAFPAAARGPALAILLRLMRHLNRRTRCVGLPLGGEDNAQGAATAMLWQAGWPGALFRHGRAAVRSLGQRCRAAGGRRRGRRAALDRGADNGGTARIRRAHRGARRGRRAGDRGRNRDQGRRSRHRPWRRHAARRHGGGAAADSDAAKRPAQRRGRGRGDPRASAGRAMITRLTGGRVFDPANGVRGEARDLFIADGRMAAPGDKVDRNYDLGGLVVMPGAIDIHSHIAGGKVNLGRLLMSEEHRETPSRAAGRKHARQRPRDAVRASPPAIAMPRWATPPPSSLPWCRRTRRQAHLEMADLPIVDKGAYVMLGNDELLLRLIASGAEQERINDYVAWMLQATAALGVKTVNPGGISAFKFNARSSRSTSADRSTGSRRAASCRRSRAPSSSSACRIPLHIHCNNLGVPGNIDTTLATIAAAEGFPLHLTHAAVPQLRHRGRPPLLLGGGALAEAVNRHRNISLDVGQIMFGQTVTASGDTMAHIATAATPTRRNGSSWTSNATAAAAWCRSAIATTISSTRCNGRSGSSCSC